MAVDWRLGLAPDVTGNAFSAFMQGQQAREQDMSRNALAAYATNPNADTLKGVAQTNPQLAITYRADMEKRNADQAAAARENLVMTAKLFDGVGDEASYQQALNTARRMKIDVSEAPPNYDQAWVSETGGVLKFFAEKPEALSTLGKIAADEGKVPGTPAFNHRVMELGDIERKKAMSIQPGGGIGIYDPQTGKTDFTVVPNYGQGQTGAPAGNPSTPQNLPRVATPQDAAKLPPGTQFLLPDGRIGTVPGGPTPKASGGFRPLGDARTAVKQVFPNARITDWRRPANSSLGRANPDSFHVLTGAAVDMEPIPGMTFQQAIERFARAGYTVHRDSRDEVNNPSGHATGPHWHFVLGGR